MPENPVPIADSHLSTAGNYSPGIVMGNYTINTLLTPTPISLEDAFKMRFEFKPSDRGYFATLDSNENVFVNGCKFVLYLGNSGTTDFVLRVFHIKVTASDFPLAKLPKKERRYGRLFVPHQLFIDLRRDAAEGWWLLSDGSKHSSPRHFEDARQDLFASSTGPRLQFRLSPGELEIIEGAITPREPCLFKLRFLFGLVSAAEVLSKASAEILIAKGEFDGG